VPTTAGHREQLTVGVPDRVATGSTDRPGDHLGGGSNLNFVVGHDTPL
jgi:hypothetical protein